MANQGTHLYQLDGYKCQQTLFLFRWINCNLIILTQPHKTIINAFYYATHSFDHILHLSISSFTSTSIMLVNRFSITFLALLAPLVMAAARPDQGPGGGSTSGGSGSGSEDDDDGGAGDVTEGIPDACLDTCTPISVVKNNCILEFGDNLNARTCICTTTDPDISTLAPLCADCVLTALADDLPKSGDIKGLL